MDCFLLAVALRPSMGCSTRLARGMRSTHETSQALPMYVSEWIGFHARLNALHSAAAMLAHHTTA